jgi:hypothetical protein
VHPIGRPLSGREADGTSEAGRYLCDLLTEHGPYRRRWEHRAGRVRSGTVSQAAVARVLAEYLWETGEHDESDQLPRNLKDRVGRALSGDVLSTQTLEWFIAAFDVSADDARHLRFLLQGGHDPHSVREALATQLQRSPDAPAPTNITLARYDLYCLDDHLATFHHRALQVVQAKAERVDRVPFRFEPTVAGVNVIRGGTASQIRTINPALRAVDIHLSRPLARGETATLEYESWTRTGPLANCFRHIVFSRIENATIVVQFREGRLPRAIWWCVWSQCAEPPIHEEKILPDPDMSVHRYLQSVEAAIYGFRWEW